MKKYFLTAIICFLCLGNTFAQKKNLNAGIADPKANGILDKASQKLKSAGAISFEATMVEKDAAKKETSRQSAKVVFSGNKYRLSFDEIVIYCNGTDVYQLDKDVREVSISKMSSSETDLMNPSKLLNNYNKNFRPKLIREESACYIIDLTPRSPQKYHKIRISVNKKYQISKVEIYYYDSSRTEYQISQYKENVQVSDKDFTFDPATHKGFEIIDMR